jgi:competence protein ComEC
VAIAGMRTHLVAGPVLGFRYYGPVEGRIVAIDRSASDALRLTLDRVTLDRVDPDRVPRRVRV